MQEFEVLNQHMIAYRRITADLWWVQFINDIDTGVWLKDKEVTFMETVADLLIKREEKPPLDGKRHKPGSDYMPEKVKKGFGKGMMAVKDKDGNRYLVSRIDPRVLSGELLGVRTGMCYGYDKDGNRYFVNNTDERFQTGELVMSKSSKRYLKPGHAERQRNLGKLWRMGGCEDVLMFDGKEVKVVSKKQMTKKLQEGWIGANVCAIKKQEHSS